MNKVSKEIKEKSKLTKEEWREYTKTVWQIANIKSKDHPAVFPEEIPHRLIKLFSFYNDTILDPFAGTGTSLFVAVRNGRNAIGIEQNRKYVSIIKSKIKKLSSKETASINIVKGDSRNIDFIKEKSIGLIVTSPPYWDKANYGRNNSNLGKIQIYKDFIVALKPVLQECYRVLIPGRKCCFVTANVNQYTNYGLLTFPLSSDLINLFRDVGFVMISELVWSKDGTGGQWGSYGNQRPIFGSYPYPPNFLFKNIHEYILIFAKPLNNNNKGNNLRNYEKLMGYKKRGGIGNGI